MADNILTLPRTQRGKALLRLCVRLCRGWDFPDGSNAADTDWDQAAIDAERDNRTGDHCKDAYEQWLAGPNGCTGEAFDRWLADWDERGEGG